MSSSAGPQYSIAHFLPWASVGGTEYGTLRLIQAVGDDQFKSIAFYINGSTSIRDLFAAEGLKAIGYDAIEPSRYRTGAFLYASLCLALKLKQMQIDVVHCSDLLASYYAGLAGRLAGLPVVCHIRNRYQDITRRDRYLLRAVNRFVFVSHDTWKHFGYRVAPERGSVIYDGVDISNLNGRGAAQDVRREFHIPGDARIVGMVARIAPQKDFKTLIKAATRVVAIYPNVRFLMVGDHSQAEEYREHYKEVKELLAANNVADHFIFTGYRTDAQRLISVMDIFVLSTHSEGLPLVILEAMAQARPVIATAVDGVPEIVLDDKTGSLYEHEDDDRLAELILSMLKDEERALGLGRAARDLVRTRFSREQFSRNITDLYLEVLGIKRAEAACRERMETIHDRSQV